MMMDSKQKHNIMFVKQWIKLRPQFKKLYCPDSFVPMARRLIDGKDYKLYSIISNFPKIGEEFYVEHFRLNEIHVEYSFHDMKTGNYLGGGAIEINKLP